MKDAGDFSDELIYNPDTDKYSSWKLRIECPYCGHTASPLCSYNTQQIESGWRWVGIDHREPYGKYKTICYKCREEYTFTVYTSQ